MTPNDKRPDDKGYRITKFFKKLPDNKIQCNLCPQNCVVENGKTGLCKARKNVNGKFYSLAYGKPSAIHIDPIEKKPLYHFMPGERILSLGTLGCNLFCKGCQNHDISRSENPETERYGYSNAYYPAEIIVEMAIRSGVRMIAYTYNEPTVFFEYMLDIAKCAKKRGIKNVMISNGYINKAPLKELLKYIDATNIDLKGFSEKFYTQYAAAKLENVLETLEEISRYNKNLDNKSKSDKSSKKNIVWLEITNLIIPGQNDDLRDIEKMCKWIKKSLGADVPLHFSRFYPDHKMQDASITPFDTLEKARNIALKSGLKHVYIGNTGLNEDTICTCGRLLISRNPVRTTMTGKENNMCGNCKKRLPGIYAVR